MAGVIVVVFATVNIEVAVNATVAGVEREVPLRIKLPPPELEKLAAAC